MPDDFDNPRHEATQAYTAAASGACERHHGQWAFEFNQRLQKALRDGAEPDEAGYREMAELEALRRELQHDLSDDLLAADAGSLR